jgi:hypothetical protein
MYMAKEIMVLDIARETVTLTGNAKRDSSAKKEMDTLLSMDAPEKERRIGITVSNQLIFLLPSKLVLPSQTSMHMAQEIMVLDIARETVTLTVNAKRDSSANKETDTLLSVDAPEKERRIGITVSNQPILLRLKPPLLPPKLRLPNLLRLKPPLPLPPKLKPPLPIKLKPPKPLPPKLEPPMTAKLKLEALP